MNGFRVDTDALRTIAAAYRTIQAELQDCRHLLAESMEQLNESGYTYQNERLQGLVRAAEQLGQQIGALGGQLVEIGEAYERAEQENMRMVERLSDAGGFVAARMNAGPARDGRVQTSYAAGPVIPVFAGENDPGWLRQLAAAAALQAGNTKPRGVDF